MARSYLCRRFATAVAAFAGALATFSPAAAFAAPQQLQCNLTMLETKTPAKQDVEAETRSISITFDDEVKTISVTQDGTSRALEHVTMTQSALNGYLADMSLGIDLSSWKIVFQTYTPDPNGIRIEYGACNLTAKP